MRYRTLIEAGELAALSRDAPDRLVLCDCRFDLADPAAGARAYAAGHLPGAHYLSLEETLSGAKTGGNGRHPLPEREALAAALARLGARPESQVVAYDAGDGMFAARLWWLLRWLGHEAAAVLNGGLAAWRAAGMPLEAEIPASPPPGDFAPRPSLTPIVDYAALRADQDQGAWTILDARAPDRFRGENETLDPVAGHIPGAVNRFFRNNLDTDGRFKPAPQLHEEFSALLGGHAPASVVSQCGSGVTAAHNLLAMEIAGLSGAALYPGSWSEWVAQPDAPVATGD